MKSILLLAAALILFTSGCQRETKTTNKTNTDQSAPKSEVLNVDEVVKAFQAARLPLGQLEFFNASSDPDKLLGKPNQYTGKVFWQTKKDMTHGIESFANEADLQTRKRFFETDKRFSGDFLYTHKNILVHIHKDLLPETAVKYEQALKSL
jgi:hypothetical protein